MAHDNLNALSGSQIEAPCANQYSLLTIIYLDYYENFGHNWIEYDDGIFVRTSSFLPWSPFHFFFN